MKISAFRRAAILDGQGWRNRFGHRSTSFFWDRLGAAQAAQVVFGKTTCRSIKHYQLPQMELTDASLVRDALALMGTANMDFADAYIAALAFQSGADELATFNEGHFRDCGMNLCAL